MARVKRGIIKKRRHKAVLSQTKGHRSVRHRLYRRAHESLIHALMYSFAGRRKKKGDMRRLWILRVNAAARINGMSYSQLIHNLKESGVDLNRKVLAQLALRDPDAFAQIVSQVKEKPATS